MHFCNFAHDEKQGVLQTCFIEMHASTDALIVHTGEGYCIIVRKLLNHL